MKIVLFPKTAVLPSVVDYIVPVKNFRTCVYDCRSRYKCPGIIYTTIDDDTICAINVMVIEDENDNNW